MNAKKTMIVVSTIAAAVTALTVALPASADDQRGSRWEQRSAAVRHADFPGPQRRETERRVSHHRPPVVYQRPVFVQRPVIVQRPVVVERTVVIARPAPVYYPEPRYVHASAPAPVYYDQPAVYRDDDRNPAGAIAGAVIGGVIGSQVGGYETRGITTVIGAIFGGIIGSGF